MQLGFTDMRCGARSWNLREEAAACFVRCPTTDDDGAAAAVRGLYPFDVVFVWQSQEVMQKAKTIENRTDQNAAMAYTAIASKASTMKADSSFTIIENGGAWVRVRGLGKSADVSGYVDRACCHHRPKA